MKKTILGTAASAAAMAFLFGCSRGGGGEVLATVQNEPITVDQFNAYLAVKPTVRVVANGQVGELPVADTLAFQAMQDLVSRSVIMQMAKEENVVPSEQQIDQEIAFQKELNPGFLSNYQGRGMNLAQIKEEVRLSLAQQNLITKGVNVTDEEVDKWLKDNPKAFVVPESYELSWILATTPERKAEVEKALQSGQAFAEVAVKLSQAPNAALTRGRYMPQQGPIMVTRMGNEMKNALAGRKDGEDTDWIKFTEGWVRFHVDKRTPEQAQPITTARKEAVRRQIALDRGARANDLQQRLVDKIAQSNIVIRRTTLKDAWKNYEELLKKQASQGAKAATQGTKPSEGK